MLAAEEVCPSGCVIMMIRMLGRSPWMYADILGCSDRFLPLPTQLVVRSQPEASVWMCRRWPRERATNEVCENTGGKMRRDS